MYTMKYKNEDNTRENKPIIHNKKRSNNKVSFVELLLDIFDRNAAPLGL